MKYLLFVQLVLGQEYPSYNFCRVFDPAEYERIIPDMGLQNAWPKNDGINPDYVDKGQVINVSGLDMYVVKGFDCSCPINNRLLIK